MWIAIGLALLSIAVLAVLRAKKISPVGWGLYGPVNTRRGVAIGGMDPLSYFDGTPALGSPAHTAEYQGARWHFTSEEHRAAFAADPARFAPQHGGFCGFAHTKGFTAVTDPSAWHIEDGKLYLFNSPQMKANWLEAR